MDLAASNLDEILPPEPVVLLFAVAERVGNQEDREEDKGHLRKSAQGRQREGPNTGLRELERRTCPLRIVELSLMSLLSSSALAAPNTDVPAL